MNKHVIGGNLKHGRNEPPLTVRRGSKVTRAHAVEILGPCKLVYSPDKPLKCGARVWIETVSEVKEGTT